MLAGMPRTSLTSEQIVRAAVALLDEEGLEGLNMRALGARLGTAATAVYWHVKTKDELVVLAADSVWLEIPLPSPVGAGGWRAAAVAMARGLLAMVTRHPWLATAMSTHLIYGEAKARHDDHALGVYEAAGFEGADAEWALQTVFVFVLGRALFQAAELSRQRRLRRTGGEERERQAAEAALAIASSYPRLRARVEAARGGADGPEGADASFETGLDLILDALESRVTP
jgi:AcrR family transcriptional regulator